jgi:peptide/nickel transport system ATP-binding protein
LPPAQAAKHRDFDESDIILKVKDLSITYNPGGSLFSKSEPVRALQNLSFDLPRGASMGLVGESGSGKSTCARGIIGLTPISGGQVYFNDHQISAMSEKQRRPLRPAMQMIFQDPYSSLNKRMSILDVIAEPIRFYGLADNRTEIEQRVVSLLERVGLNGDALKRFPHQFSGGQRQRIAVARTLASKPELIICDEPTSALDVSVQAAVLNLIKDLQDEYNLSLLFISHDLPVVRQMCDDIIVLKQGKLVEMDHTDRIFDNPQADYTKELIDLMPHMDDFKQAQ